MLAPVRKRTKFLSRLFLLASLTLLAAACATQKEPPRLVADPTSKPESSLPWNKQEKWEVGGGIPGALGDSR
jgi:uncharacterized lipoprotein YajG